MLTEANPQKENQKAQKSWRKWKRKVFKLNIVEGFEVECILKENQSHYKVHWLGYNMTQNSWVNKKDIEENAPEV